MTYRLSKSTFQKGLQCQRALWLKFHDPSVADEVPETRQAIFDSGNEVGELARERFGGGVLVAEDYRQSAEALETTGRLLEDPPAAIYEAALSYGGVFVRADVVVPVGHGEWDMYEVKSSNKLKAENITDVAVQTWVAEGAGLKIRRAYLMHLDGTYVYPGGDYDLERLFIAEDVTEQIRGYIPTVAPRVAEMQSMLEGTEPGTPIGKHCENPYTCDFFGYCHSYLPAQPVTELPGIKAELLAALIADGILAVQDVPLSYPGLTRQQREVCELVRSGEAEIVGDIGRSLQGLIYPIHFLDFETYMSALPPFPGTHSWQMIPFQWSAHVLYENGDLEHREFLHEGAGDPRPSLTETLVQALGDTGSVVVYSSFERSRLKDLAIAFPEHAEAIAAILPRLFDLLQTVRAHVRHPDCLGSSSIKAVLPALVKDLSYEGLGIADGNLASTRYRQAATGKLTADECQLVYADLRAYCGTDTLAMVRLLEVLQAGAC
jgi:hypothetical protein